MTTRTSSIQFTAPVETVGRWSIVRLPQEASQPLPSRGQVSVTGTLNGRPFTKVLEPDGRLGHWFKLEPDQTEESDTVAVEISPTKVWPEPTLPEDWATALAEAPAQIRALWTDITPMARWEWVRWINATNNPETRQRRVEVSISKMEHGKRRPCCFNLAACTDPDLARNAQLVEPLTSAMLIS